jgi:hypothetical protein
MGLLTLEIVLFVIGFLLRWIFLTIVFYAAGRLVSGVNAKFTDALLVALIGSIISEVLHEGFRYVLVLFGIGLPDLIAGIASALITVIVYIPLFMHFFDTSLGGALLIGLICVIFYVLIAFLTAFLVVFLGFLILFGP